MHSYQNTVASMEEDIHASFGKLLFQGIALLIAPTWRKVNGKVGIFVLIDISRGPDRGLQTEGLDKKTKLGDQVIEDLIFRTEIHTPILRQETCFFKDIPLRMERGQGLSSNDVKDIASIDRGIGNQRAILEKISWGEMSIKMPYPHREACNFVPIDGKRVKS